MLSNNNKKLNISSFNNDDIVNGGRDLFVPLLSPEILFGFENNGNNELENIDILGEKEFNFNEVSAGMGSSLLFSSPNVPFSIESDSCSNIGEIIDETINGNSIPLSEINLNESNSSISSNNSNNIFQFPQDSSSNGPNANVLPFFESNSISPTSNTTPIAVVNSSIDIQEPPPLTEPLPLSNPCQPLSTVQISPEQEKIMMVKDINTLIEEKHLFDNKDNFEINLSGQDSIKTATPTSNIILNSGDNNNDTVATVVPPHHKDRKPRRPPEYPIHQVNLLMQEQNNIMICKECNYKAKTRKSVQSHIRRVHTEQLDRIREDCNEIFQAKKDDYNKDSIVCDHYGCGAIIVKYNKSKHYRQPHHIGHPKEIAECYRCKEVKQRTMMRNLKKEMNKSLNENCIKPMEIN